MISKVQDCVVFDHVSEDRTSIPPLSIPDTKNTGIIRQEFLNEQNLQKSLLSKAFWYLRQKKNDLIRRPSN